MLTPRLTNCQDCHKIPDLLKQIDCKLAELSNDAYNDVVFMLGNCIPAYEINQLLAYKRILTFKYCNPHYAGCTSVNDIAGKVIRLTAGCVSRCNEPTVCEITTCAVEVVPNPTTTTTSTSSTSTTTTTSTSTSSTTTTTTTIYPDCRIEGCFETLTTTTTTSSTSSTTTTTTTNIVFDCIEAFDFTDPESFPNVETGNGTKILSNGVQLITTYTGIAPTYVPGTPGTFEICNGAYMTNQSGGQGNIGMKGGSTLVMNFNPPINAIAFVSGAYGSFRKPGNVEILSITSPQEIAATEITACGPYITSQIDQNTVNLSGTVTGLTTSSGVTAISPVSGNISELTLVLSPPADELAGIVLDFYVCPGPTTTTTTTLPVFLCTNPLLTVSLPDGVVGDPLNGSVVYDGLNLAITSYTYSGGSTTVYIAGTVAYTLGFIVPSGYSNSGSASGCAVVATSTSPTTTTTTTTVTPTTTTTTTVAPTTTTTTTLPPLVGCLEFDYLTLVTGDNWYTDPPQPVGVNTPSLYVQAAFGTGATTNTTSFTQWSQVPNTNYDVVFNIGGVDYTAVYQFINLGTGAVTVPYGKFSTNGDVISSMYAFQFSKIDANGNDLSSILSTFDYTNGDGIKVTAYGDCTTPTTTTTTTTACVKPGGLTYVQLTSDVTYDSNSYDFETMTFEQICTALQGYCIFGQGGMVESLITGQTIGIEIGNSIYTTSSQCAFLPNGNYVVGQASQICSSPRTIISILNGIITAIDSPCTYTAPTTTTTTTQ